MNSKNSQKNNSKQSLSAEKRERQQKRAAAIVKSFNDNLILKGQKENDWGDEMRQAANESLRKGLPVY